jgi:hypothetical protein
MKTDILKQGVTHPTIDLDFYEWFAAFCNSKEQEFDKTFILQRAGSLENAKTILMYAWQRSREYLRDKANDP